MKESAHGPLISAGQSLPSTATDVFDYAALDPVWADVKSETVTHYQRAAAFRALAALARSSLNSDPDDLTLVSHLMAAVATTLDRCEAARRRKLPFGIGQGSKRVSTDRFFCSPIHHKQQPTEALTTHGVASCCCTCNGMHL